MVESVSFLLSVIAKYLYVVLTSIEPQRILNLSIHKHSISTESGGLYLLCKSLEDQDRSLPLNLGESLRSWCR